MEDFEHFGCGVKARQVDSEHVEVAKGDDNSAVLDEDDLEALAAVDDNAIIVGNDVVADPNSSGELITLREVSGDHIVTISQHDDVPEMCEMLQAPKPEVILVSNLGSEAYITDFGAVEITTEHGGMTTEMLAEFDDDVCHPDSPQYGNKIGGSADYDRNWYFTEVRKP